jgi:hypothetical protein
MFGGSPGGGTPLCKHIRAVTEQIRLLEPTLRQTGNFQSKQKDRYLSSSSTNNSSILDLILTIFSTLNTNIFIFLFYKILF